MNPEQSTTLTAVIPLLQQMPDPRWRRGVRYPWWVLLATICAAMLADCNEVRAMAEWAADHRDELAEWLPLPRHRAPSECTLQRTLRQVPLDRLGELINHVQEADEPAVVLEPVALDGKSLRAASTPAQPLHVLELSRHRDGALLRLGAVGRKLNEYSASPALLAGYDLSGRVVTGDAMFCQRRLAQFINARGGHWLFAVKENQPELHEALVAHFSAPRSGPYPLDIKVARTSGRGHGRLERRVLEASAELAPYLGWPGAAQAIRRTTIRCVHGQDQGEVHYWLTSLPPELADPALLERFCRGHWSIENLVNRTRDVTFGEDRCTMRCGSAPLALAMLRGLVRWLALFGANFPEVPQARRHFSRRPQAALALLGATRL